MHDQVIDDYGGSHGIRDLGMLESALFRPQTGYYDSIIHEAVALMESLLMNHPFIDGNKRTAFAATYTFLGLNGYELDVDPKNSEPVIVGFTQTQHRCFEDIVKWLEQSVIAQ